MLTYGSPVTYDAVWNAESGGFKEHVLHGNADASTKRGTFVGLVCFAKFGIYLK